MTYRYETHLHTCQASACGISTGAEQARFYHDLGYRGIFMTDHFFGGNSCVPRELPWKERIGQFASGWEDALIQGQKLGLQVFFGWEQGYGDDEYLIYGLSPEWLSAHPEIEHASRREQYVLVHAAGGAVMQAHPFRDRAYIEYVRLGLQFCDGIEAVNASNRPVNDLYALRYAGEYHLVVSAGSDNHDFRRMAQDPETRLAGLELTEPLTCGEDYAAMLRAHRQPGLFFSQERLRVPPEERDTIPSWWMNDVGDPLPTHRDWLSEFPEGYPGMEIGGGL